MSSNMKRGGSGASDSTDYSRYPAAAAAARGSGASVDQHLLRMYYKTSEGEGERESAVAGSTRSRRHLAVRDHGSSLDAGLMKAYYRATGQEMEEEEEEEDEDEDEESDIDDPSPWGRRSRGVRLTASFSRQDDPAVYRPPATQGPPSHRTSTPEQAPPPPRTPASTTTTTTTTTKKERATRKAPSYMPQWRCDVCDDEMSVFLRDEHCRTKAHQRLARRAGGSGEPSVASASERGGGDGSVYAESEYEPSTRTRPSQPGYRMRTTFYCPPCAEEFPLRAEALHGEQSPTYMCTCCVRRIHTAGRGVHERGEGHQQMARLRLAADDGGGGDDDDDDVVAGENGLSDGRTPWQGYRVRDTFYCMLCAGEFPQSAEALHGEDSPTHMCLCCVGRMHSAGRAAHERGGKHQQMAALAVNDDEGGWGRGADEVGAEEQGGGAKSILPGQFQPRKRGRRRNVAEMESLVDEGDVRGAVSEAEAEAKEVVVRETETMDTRSQTSHYKNREGDTAGDEQQEAIKQARKERKLKRKAEQRGEQAAGGQKPVWSCDVCKEPLLGEQLTSHKAWHCQSGTGSGGAVAAGKTAQRPNGVLSPPSPTPLPTLHKVARSPAQPQGSPIPATATPPTRVMPAPQPEVAPPTPPPPPPTATFFCEPCNRHISVGNRTAHDTSPKHAKKAAQYAVVMRAAAQVAPPRPPPSEPSSSTETFFCGPCNRSLAVVGRTGHFAGATHIKKVQAIAAVKEGERRAKQAALAATAAAKEKDRRAKQAAAATAAAEENERRARQAAADTAAAAQANERKAKQAAAAKEREWKARQAAAAAVAAKDNERRANQAAAATAAAAKEKEKKAKQAAAAAKEKERKAMQAAQESETRAKQAGAATHNPPAPHTAPPSTAPKQYCRICDRYQFPGRMDDHCNTPGHKKKAEAAAEAAAALAVSGPMTGAQQGSVLPTAQRARPRSPPPLPVGTGMQAEMCVPVGLGPGMEGDKWVKITGERFYCEVCERERSMQGVEDHVGSALHRRKAREREEAEGGGGTG